VEERLGIVTTYATAPHDRQPPTRRSQPIDLQYRPNRSGLHGECSPPIPYRNVQLHYSINPHDLKFTRTVNDSYRDDLQFVAVVYRDDGLLANSASITAHIQVQFAVGFDCRWIVFSSWTSTYPLPVIPFGLSFPKGICFSIRVKYIREGIPFARMVNPANGNYIGTRKLSEQTVV
jgi:hypothetical protein